MIGLVALTVGVAQIAHYVGTNVSGETLFTIFQGSLIGLVLYACYSLLLTRLEMNEKYKELDK